MRRAIAVLLLAVSGAWSQSYSSGGTYPANPAALQGAPAWLRYLGNGADGAVTCSSLLSGNPAEIDTTSFTVNNGATCSVSAALRLSTIIRSTGTCTIAGTITTASAVGITAQGDSGGGGGGGGGGTGAGSAGSNSSILGNQSVLNTTGAAGTAGGGAGAAGASIPTGIQEFLLGTGIMPRGGSAGGAGGSSGPAGGLGSSNIILVCASINFTGTITANGFNGANSTGNNVGASGGGGGGVVVLSAVNYAANTGTVNVNGGTGGSCLAFTGCGAGGNGGAGWSAALTIQ
jgi:hypothetical protein